MTDPNYRHIAIVVDRSGSMQTIKDDTEGGLAAFLADQAQMPGRATASLYEFDDEYAPVYENLEIGAVPRYTLVPRGATALYDAVGRTIVAVGEQFAAMPEAERPGTVVLVIDTDGFENRSTEYTGDRVKEMITHQQEVYGWVVYFLGADQDAFVSAGAMGIGRGHTLSYAGASTSAAFASVSASVTRGSSGLGYQFTENERATASGLATPAQDTDGSE